MVGLLGSSGRRPARDLRAEALRSRAPPPRRCPAPAGRRYRPQRSPSTGASTNGQTVLRSPGSLSPCKITAQGRTCGASLARWRSAPPLTMIFPGKTSAPIRRTGRSRRLSGLVYLLHAEPKPYPARAGRRINDSMKGIVEVIFQHWRPGVC